MEEVREIITRDISSAEIKWTLFNYALKSYRHDSLLKPFPNRFLRSLPGCGEDVKDFERLSFVAASIPPLDRIKYASTTLNDDQVYLLDFVLKCKQSTFQSLRKNEWPAEILPFINENPAKNSHIPVPSHVFRVTSKSYSQNQNDPPQGTEAGTSDADNTEPTDTTDEKLNNKFLACHGSKMENFYSIMNYGLLNNLNKAALFGEGTYLSTNLRVALNFSPVSRLQHGASILGQRVSCVAVCEVTNDGSSGLRIESKKPSTFKSAFSQGVPETYIVVRNDSLLKVKYLMVFAEKAPPPNRLMSGAKQWIFDQRMCLFMFAYFAMLVAIGFAGSNKFKLYFLRWQQFFGSTSESYNNFNDANS